MAYCYVLLLLPTLQLTRAALRRWYTWNCSPPYARITSSLARLFVAFAGTKHYCLTAVNRDGALCCPDFPRRRGLKPQFFFPYSAIDRYTVSKFAVCVVLEACFVFLVTYREPRGLEVRGAIAVALNRMAISLRQANCDERAAYGNRTRLLGLGSRCTTDVLMPQNRCKGTKLFTIYQIYNVQLQIFRLKVERLRFKDREIAKLLARKLAEI